MVSAQASQVRSPAERWSARSMRNGFCLLCLILFAAVTVLLRGGGGADPHGSGQALDGPWRFHAGDNPAWAAPVMDDSNWDLITLAPDPKVNDGDVGIPGYFEGWRARGHPHLDGYGWYRRPVTLPPRGDYVLVGPPAVDDGYEIYWNGKRLGGIGRLSGTPKVNTTRPLLARLPAASDGHTNVLAIRAFMQPLPGRGGQSGGLRTVPVVAQRADGEALYRAQWRRTIAGYVVDAVEPALMLLLAVFAALAAPARARPWFGRWLALALTASACLRLGNAISAWTDLIGAPQLVWQNSVVLAPLAKLAWTLAWNQWTEGRDRRLVSFAAVAAGLLLVAGAIAGNDVLAGAGRALIALSLSVITVRVARFGDHRLWVLPAMAMTAVGLFAADLSALGAPGIWFPFGIGVSRSQYAYAIAIPLLAYVLAAWRDPAGIDTGTPLPARA